MWELMSTIKFCAPFYQIVLLLGFSTLALIFGNLKMALSVNYLFTLYWVYVSDRTYILDAGTKQSPFFPWLFFGFGFVVFLLVILGLLIKKE